MQRSSLSLSPFASLVLALALVLGGCPKKPDKDAAADAGASALPVDPVAIPKESAGDPARGKELVGTFQCNRCHDGTGHAAAPQNKHCVHCHKDIMEDRFKAPAASIMRWKPRVAEYADAPSLEATGKRLSRRWVEQYLLAPTDLRPNLHQYMPRLPITAAEARDISAYLVPDADAPAALPAAIAKADLGKGRQLLETKGCGSCHVMSGVAALPSSSFPATA